MRGLTDNAGQDHVEASPMTPLVAAALTGPVLGGTALAALVLVIVAYDAVGALVTVAHEAGHVVVGALTGGRIHYFEVSDGTAGVTVSDRRRWGPGRILAGAAGYLAPPLLGLGGAAILAAGLARPLLWTVVVLLVLALPKAEREWTTFLLLVSGAATGYVAIYGSALSQAAFAAGLVWLLLFGGARDVLESGTDDRSDAAHLARDTLIPRKAWKGAFIVVALICLWKGFLLLKP
jgi:Peptidase M50B-like